MAAPLADVAGVIFDFDGTLTEPSAIDFAVMRAAIGCPADENILTWIESLPTAVARQDAIYKVNAIELEAAAVSHPNPGAEALLLGLAGRGLPLAVLTRNSREAVERALANFATVGPELFGTILTRDDPLPAKPEPHGVAEAARRLGLDPRDCVMIGDYRYDIEAGIAAGSRTVWVHHRVTDVPWSDLADYAVGDLYELAALFGLALR